MKARGTRRGAAAWERFEGGAAGGGGGTLLYTVFTIPPALRGAVQVEGRWGKLRRAAWKLLKALGAAFGLEATHPVGDAPDCGLCGAPARWGWASGAVDGLRAVCSACGGEGPMAEFHPHLNFLWTRKGTQKGALEAWELEGLKRGWAAALGLEGRENVYHDFVKGGPKWERMRKHRIRYVVRAFPGLMEWAGNLRWYGRPPVLKEKDAAPAVICECCGREMRYAGACTAAEAAAFKVDEQKRWLRSRGIGAGSEIDVGPPAPAESDSLSEAVF